MKPEREIAPAVQVSHYENGVVESSTPDGWKLSRFRDGTVHVLSPDGHKAVIRLTNEQEISGVTIFNMHNTEIIDPRMKDLMTTKGAEISKLTKAQLGIDSFSETA